MLIMGPNRVAIELQLTFVDRPRLKQMLVGYRAEQGVTAVLYLVDDDSVGSTVESVAAKLGIAPRVHVQRGGFPARRWGIAQLPRPRTPAEREDAASEICTVPSCWTFSAGQQFLDCRARPRPPASSPAPPVDRKSPPAQDLLTKIGSGTRRDGPIGKRRSMRLVGGASGIDLVLRPGHDQLGSGHDDSTTSAGGASLSAVREPFDVVIVAPRAILPDGEQSCAVGVAGGQIAAVEALPHRLAAQRTVRLDDDVVVLPGLVDSHVHICEPGNTDWEGFATATLAAAAGGITTLVDMPLDSIPTTTDVAALEVKRKAADGQCHVDVGFWGGVVPGNLSDLAVLREAGALGFKCFLVDSGCDEFPPVSAAEMEAALTVLARLDAPLLVHAESDEVAVSLPVIHSARYADYLRSRPRGLENLAVAQVIEAARRTGGHAHVCHVSSSDVVPMIRSAQADGLCLTAETCPHYLVLSADDVADGMTSIKCSPPIRERANRDLLWDALRDGVFGAVVSDHSPCTVEMKQSGGGDFATAWGGISSIQVAVPAVWSEARARGFSLSDIASWMAEAPAKLAGLPLKGSIEVGKDADLCVLAPDEQFTVDPARLFHRHPLTPYDGRTLTGVVRQTWLRGQLVDPRHPRGRLLSPGGRP